MSQNLVTVLQKKSVVTVSGASEEEMLTSVFQSVRAGLQNLADVEGFYFQEFAGWHQPHTDRETGEWNLSGYLFPL